MEPLPSDRSALSFKLADPQGRLTVHVERLRPDGRYFQKGSALGLWYARDPGASDPAWTGNALKRLASALLNLTELADELTPATTTALPLAKAAPTKAFPQYSVFDLVLRGLKPVGSLLVPNENAAPEVVRKLPVRLLSTFGFARDARDNLSFVSTPAGQTMRMLYAGHDAQALQRLESLERFLYEQRHRPNISDAQAEVGRLLGFPDCCAQAFAHNVRETTARHGDLYASLERASWRGRPIDWRTNHILAKQYALPLLTHEPCTPDCAATARWVEAAIAALYTPAEVSIVREILRLGAVVFPDDRMVLFEAGEQDSAGVVSVRRFNQDPHLNVLGSQRPDDRRVPASPDDRAVQRLRVRDGRLEVDRASGWQVFASAQVSQVAPPLLVLPTSGQAAAAFTQSVAI